MDRCRQSVKVETKAGREERTVIITLNGETREVPESLTLASLLKHLGVRPDQVAVEVNRGLVTRKRHEETRIAPGVLEVVTLVGGGAGSLAEVEPEPLTIGSHTFRSRLFVGTGKYETLELMRDCLDACGAEVVTVAVRRERLFDKSGRNCSTTLTRLATRSCPIRPAASTRRKHADRPAWSRAARRPGKPGFRLGQAGSPGRHAHPPA